MKSNKPITFNPMDYLIEKDKKRIREIKILVKHSTDLREIYEYQDEMEHLIKKAYIRKTMQEEKWGYNIIHTEKKK